MTETTVTTATPATLKRAAARLHAARQRVDKLTAWWEEKMQALREIHANTLHDLEEAKIDAAEAETALRAAALTEFEATGKKTLGHGVGIRTQKRFEYDRDQALRWAYANRKALALDVKAFEKLAKDEQIAFVATVEEITVTLPKDSAKLVGEG